MILPAGNCKKYIKVVIGIYIVFTIVSPVISKFTHEGIYVSKDLELEEYIKNAEDSANIGSSVKENNKNNIRSMYIEGLKEDITAKLIMKGYEVNNIKVEINDLEKYTINSITLQLVKQNEQIDLNEVEESQPVNVIRKIESVEKVNISNNEIIHNDKENMEDKNSNEVKETLSKKEKSEIKKYLSSVYEVKEDNIIIK